MTALFDEILSQIGNYKSMAIVDSWVKPVMSQTHMVDFKYGQDLHQLTQDIRERGMFGKFNINEYPSIFSNITCKVKSPDFQFMDFNTVRQLGSVYLTGPGNQF